MAKRTESLRTFAQSLVTCSIVLLLVSCVILYLDVGRSYLKYRSRTRRNSEYNSTQQAEDALNCTRRGIESFPDGIFSDEQLHHGAFVVNVIVAAYMCGAISYICTVYFVPSLEILYHRMNLQPDVAGATFMAAGSSAPEFFTAMIGTFISKDDTGVGAILGSAAFNIFVITAICCFFTSKAVVISWWPFFRDIMVYILSIIFLFLFLLDDVIEWWEGLILMLGYLFYILILYFNPVLSMHAEDILFTLKSIVKGSVDENDDDEEEMTEDDPSNLKSDLIEKEGYGALESDENVVNKSDNNHRRQRLESWRTEPPVRSVLSPPDGLHWRFIWCIGLPLFIVFFITIPDCRKPGWQSKLYFVTFLLSATWLAITTYVLYWMITVIGYTLDVTDSVMGLTLLAAGTSLPDTIASMLVARDGLGDMAVSNIFGSNIFEVFICLGLLWFIANFINGPVVLASSGVTFTSLSLILMVVFIVVIIYVNDGTLNYKTGSFCLASYVLFLFLSIFNELGFIGKTQPPIYCTG